MRATAAAAEERLDTARAEREALESELAQTAAGGDDASRTLLALGAARGRLEQRHEAATAMSTELAAELASAQALAASGRPSPAELEQGAERCGGAGAPRRAGARRGRGTLHVPHASGSAALDAALAEQEGLPPAARAFAAEGERLVVTLVDPEPGDERAVAAALGWRASAILADTAPRGLELLERAHSAGLGSLSVLVGADPARLGTALPVVALDELLDSRGPAVTREGFGYDPDRGELWFTGETAEAVLLEMQARRKALADEADELEARAEVEARSAAEAAARSEAAEAAYAEVAHLRGRSADPATLSRLAPCAETLARSIARAADVAGRLAPPLESRISGRSERAAGFGAKLAQLAAGESALRSEAAAVAARIRAAEVVVARLGGHLAETAGAGNVDALAEEATVALAAAEAAATAARAAADRAAATEAALLARSPRRSSLDADLLGRLTAAARALSTALGSAEGLAARLDAPVHARVDAGAHRASKLGEELRLLGATEVELRAAAEDAAQRATTVEVELVRLEADADEARRRRAAAGEVEPAEGDDRAELATRVERLETRRAALGQVNPLAQEEYETEKERLEELTRQRADLEASLAEIEKLRDELAETVQRRFTETFDAVAENFADVASTLFPGGEGRLRLVEPEEDGGEHGVEVELRPAGKRITRLSLLSGGEKALGAISFLFALFLARPCPFYLLDEVEAALDDTNIARFVELLRRYADRAQFVVITHQKRTMEAADVLYGVTMGADGVSQVVSRRLPPTSRRARIEGPGCARPAPRVAPELSAAAANVLRCR